LTSARWAGHRPWAGDGGVRVAGDDGSRFSQRNLTPGYPKVALAIQVFCCALMLVVFCVGY